MRIGILTGGGDVPGLNPCIKAAVYRAEDAGVEVIGIKRGWAGLLNYNFDSKNIQPVLFVIKPARYVPVAPFRCI